MQLQNAKTIAKRIKSIVGRAATLQTDIHETALQCLMHAEEHKDATLARDLLCGLGKGQRVEALNVWFQTFSPIFVDVKTGKCGLLKEGVHKKYNPFDADKAAHTPYYDLTSEAVRFTVMSDVLGAPFAALNRLDKAYAEERFAGSEEDYENTRSKIVAMCDMVGDITKLREEGKAQREAAEQAAAA